MQSPILQGIRLLRSTGKFQYSLCSAPMGKLWLKTGAKNNESEDKKRSLSDLGILEFE